MRKLPCWFKRVIITTLAKYLIIIWTDTVRTGKDIFQRDPWFSEKCSFSSLWTPLPWKRDEILKNEGMFQYSFWYSTQIRWFYTNLWLCVPRFFGGYRELMLKSWELIDRIWPNFVYALILTRSRFGEWPSIFCKLVTKLWPLIDVIFPFPLNILRTNW